MVDTHPIFLLIKGQPGSGKSTIACKLAAQLSWPIIDKDDIRNCFQARAVDCSSIDWNSLSYDVLFSVTEAQLRVGLNVIVDCPWARKQLYARASQMAIKESLKKKHFWYV